MPSELSLWTTERVKVGGTSDPRPGEDLMFQRCGSIKYFYEVMGKAGRGDWDGSLSLSIIPHYL